MNSANTSSMPHTPTTSAENVAQEKPRPRLVVVGGSGFIGTRLLNLLVEDGRYELSNIDIAKSAAHPQITKPGDVRRLFDMLNALRGCDTVLLLAAEHRDDVHPASRYTETNVHGMSHVLEAMSRQHVRRIIFVSSVAVYGMNHDLPNEDSPLAPANDYGRSKLQAEELLRKWHSRHPERSVTIVRPTVVFGENNRGNVYNLLHQIQCGRFAIVGSGENVKSMAYVGNVAAFLQHIIYQNELGYHVYNYVDKPDYTMNDLVRLVSDTLHRHVPTWHVPMWMGMLGGYCFDALSFVTRRRFAISSQRVRKFCATTQFPADRVASTGFQPPYPIDEALRQTLQYEFGNKENE